MTKRQDASRVELKWKVMAEWEERRRRRAELRQALACRHWRTRPRGEGGKRAGQVGQSGCRVVGGGHWHGRSVSVAYGEREFVTPCRACSRSSDGSCAASMILSERTA